MGRRKCPPVFHVKHGSRAVACGADLIDVMGCQSQAGVGCGASQSDLRGTWGGGRREPIAIDRAKGAPLVLYRKGQAGCVVIRWTGCNASARALRVVQISRGARR